ncbi:hypothetical protein ABVK25_012565 [Lepraria finkii]|uniref:Uncharacterized protein n=1 Tax=Lepraria finkii TaxID=1340010 RepID=A0ABR4ABM3_9LECA
MISGFRRSGQGHRRGRQAVAQGPSARRQQRVAAAAVSRRGSQQQPTSRARAAKPRPGWQPLRRGRRRGVGTTGTRHDRPERREGVLNYGPPHRAPRPSRLPSPGSYGRTTGYLNGSPDAARRVIWLVRD